MVFCHPGGLSALGDRQGLTASSPGSFTDFDIITHTIILHSLAGTCLEGVEWLQSILMDWIQEVVPRDYRSTPMVFGL